MTSTRLSLDDLYHMVVRIYGERNAERSVTATFAHFTEVCGMLTAHDRRKRESISVEDALCKALGWYFPLLAKFHVASVEDLIFKKFPYACPYCRECPHQEKPCKVVRGTRATVNHEALKAVYEANAGKRPASLNGWQLMFSEIYPRQTETGGRSTLGLFEELGEMAEAVRVFDRYPKYLAGEAADVFSYLMGIANEHLLREEQAGREFSLEDAFIQRYPGLCTQCGYQVCLCPVVPEATVGRMAKEVDLLPTDKLFENDPAASGARGEEAAHRVLDGIGGYAAVNWRFPFDRGETNQALSVVCIRLANAIDASQPELAKKLRTSAEQVASSPSRPGSREHPRTTDDVVRLLRKAFEASDRPVSLSDSSLPGTVERLLSGAIASLVRFGIVTALPKEFAAARTMLDSPQPCAIADDPNDYVVGSVPARDGSGEHRVALTLLKKTGNNTAASAAAHLLRSFTNVTDVIMVGIAGGCPHPADVSKHIRLGDIVVSGEDGVIQYDHVRLTCGEARLRGASSPPSAAMIGKIRLLQANMSAGARPWEEYFSRFSVLEGGTRPSEEEDRSFFIGGEPTLVPHPPNDQRRPGLPKVVVGRIGAANLLLKDAKYRDALRDGLGIRAVEMEGSGIADGTWHDDKHYLLVRGIADYGDPAKGDAWHTYAAGVAAAFARAVIETFAAVTGVSADQRRG